MKNCPVSGCKTKVATHLAMCRKHWRKVPKPLRDELWRAYDDGAGVWTDEYREALDSAVKAASG